MCGCKKLFTALNMRNGESDLKAAADVKIIKEYDLHVGMFVTKMYHMTWNIVYKSLLNTRMITIKLTIMITLLASTTVCFYLVLG